MFSAPPAKATWCPQGLVLVKFLLPASRLVSRAPGAAAVPSWVAPWPSSPSLFPLWGAAAPGQGVTWYPSLPSVQDSLDALMFLTTLGTLLHLPRDILTPAHQLPCTSRTFPCSCSACSYDPLCSFELTFHKATYSHHSAHTICANTTKAHTTHAHTTHAHTTRANSTHTHTTHAHTIQAHMCSHHMCSYHTCLHHTCSHHTGTHYTCSHHIGTQKPASLCLQHLVGVSVTMVPLQPPKWGTFYPPSTHTSFYFPHLVFSSDSTLCLLTHCSSHLHGVVA